MSLTAAATVLVGGLLLGAFVHLPMRSDLRSLGRQFGIGWKEAWSCYLLAVAGVASVSGVAGSLPENSWLTVGLWALYFPGWLALAYAAGNYGLARRLRATERTETGAVTGGGSTTGGPDGDGGVAVSGEVTAVGDAARTPLLGDEAVCYTWTVERHRKIPHGWWTAATGRGGVPFEIDDGSGPVRVDPAGAELRLWGVGTRQVDEEDTPPMRAVEFLDEQDVGFDPDGTTHRYEERKLVPGDTAYVLGRARSPDAGGHAGETAVVEGGEPFLVGAGELGDAAQGLGRAVRYTAVGGAVGVALGYVGMVVASGAV